MSRDLYAAPAMRWRRNEMVVYTARAPEAPFMWRQDALGEHARWMIGMRRKHEWGRHPTWGDIIFMRRYRDIVPEHLEFIDLPWWTRPLGWLVALWAVREALRA